MGKHTPLDEQQALVEAWRQSGQSPLVFAAAHGLRVGSLRSWIARHAPMERGEAVTFLEVLSVPVQAPALFSVQVAGLRLTFEQPPPPAWFAALLRQLSC
jgi:hypothetical protein